MTETEEIIIYDTMLQIQESAPVLVALLKERSTPQEVAAYKTGIYAAVVRLGTLFTEKQHAAHKERHRKLKAECDAFFAEKANRQK
jgi:hypothetical protein